MEKYQPSDFALQIFRDRYALHPEETFEEACHRVSKYIGEAEEGSNIKKYTDKFFEMMIENRFSPGGRIWRGSGRPRGQLMNCFVLDDDIDSREGWGETLKNVTIISGTGGGIGINFSKIRPRGAKLHGTDVESTGSISLMKKINGICNELKEGGGRRGALLFCLNWDHPDIPEFLSVKLDHKELSNANISVTIDKQFLKLLDNDEDIVFKWQGNEMGKMLAKELWAKLIYNAWKSGDPGLLNLQMMQDMNPLFYSSTGKIISTNPCGEQPLPAFGSCDLGAIVLPSHVIDGKLNLDLLNQTITSAVRFLDNVIDKNYYPLPIIEETCGKHRRIGLGIMGLHDVMLEVGIKYSSNEALGFTENLMKFIKGKAYDASIFLAVEKGQFKSLDREKHIQGGFVKKCLTPGIRRKILEYGLRNCCLLTCAPTGTTSIVAGISSGIEPIFAPIYKRNFNRHINEDGDEKEKHHEIVIHPLLKKFKRENKSIDHFESAHDIPPDHHLKIQAICQKHIDSSISKTINLPSDYKADDLGKIIRTHIEDLKGVTVYRDKSKKNSPLIPFDIKELDKYIDIENVREEVVVPPCKTGKCGK